MADPRIAWKIPMAGELVTVGDVVGTLFDHPLTGILTENS
tara:strand:- start:78 stop:197 length:120 start_codon:yes stop_codon:yes gene_type:complete